MADDHRVTNGNEMHEPSDNNSSGEPDRNLRAFATQEFQNQRMNGQSDHDDITDDRATQFLQRAINESERMSAETSRSQRRQQRLYAELGKERFEQWTKEHLEETLKDAARKADEEAMSVER